MIKKFDIEKDIYEYENFLQHPLFEYLFILKQIKILSKEEYYDWQYTIENKMVTVEHDVTREDVIKNLKTQLRKDVTNEEIDAIINNKMFNYDNVVDLVIKGRINKNLDNNFKKMRETFKGVLEEIVNE